jgi:hypothetical protein
MMKTYNLEDIEHAENFGSIEQTRSGKYELVIPNKLSEEIKRFMGNKDFDMDIIKESDDTLRIELSPKKSKNRGSCK